MSYVYLASPYTHPDPQVMEARYIEARKTLFHLLSQRIWTYSPIVHCHELAKAHSLPRDHEFWLDYDRAMIERASALYVLILDGWRESRGVQAEVEFAQRLPVPITHVEPYQ